MIRLLLLSALVAVGCSKKQQDRTPPPAEKAATPVEKDTPPPAAPVAAPLDPVRVEAEKNHRDALALVSRALPCPQQPPSTYVRYCKAIDDFAAGKVADLAEGDTILVGEMSIINQGPPSVSTLGTPMPVAFLLRREGSKISAKQVVLQHKDNDAMATLVARVGKTIDGTWDHVDVPAVFADQFKTLATTATDPLDESDGALWPHDRDGMELRRANGRWLLVAAPEGPDGRHIIGILVDKHRVLGPKEKSPQKVTVLHL